MSKITSNTEGHAFYNITYFPKRGRYYLPPIFGKNLKV
jgi:hypothetical protein